MPLMPPRNRKRPPRPRLQIVPDALRAARLRNGFSIPQLAHLSKISPTRISNLERGDRPGVYPATARALAGALNCRFDEITEVVGGTQQEEAV